ncbi:MULTISPECIES: 4,5-DOPA dioxygenase extradiol [unclassified Arcicella]|uniref:4,5-DOPA-extradiol-dioxygenase n=1 Tax=unclassified Arcicella TaxID=2644986 RepID=UPI00285E9F34|nr:MULTISPECIES: 4,5-DOPA dioxygenase extradiol [unclassified Arcicella]MDR6562784.1 4,5-DOPA dioxygenase extradiol [Arcicella sp. BE51]MDR6812872.1 4,5-DOPA dioxygenase extradiol [Arcicella sp. BE140]MDR6824186.1 4,5-DOPA dioxygenase extradiol [Arcicella sp. BE139]
MKRKEFIKASVGVLTMSALGTLKAFSDQLSKQEQKTPLYFIGHGSPMNGIENNQFSQQWASLANDFPEPTAVIVISAHWLTRGTFVTAMEKPRTIHDFGGFPQALFDVQYPAKGSLAVAEETKKLITKTEVHLDHEWGLDHGTWTIIRHIYPKANIPVLQLSIDYHQSPQYHYELAQELAVLRRKGVLIIGSGNMVHNLRMVDFRRIDGAYGYDWTIEMNEKFKKNIAENNHKPLINYESMGEAAKLAIPTPDHYYPLLYILGMQEKNEEVSFFNDVPVGGSLTMTSVKIA